MRDIDLPITQTFSITIDTHNFDMSKAVKMEDGRFAVPLGTIVDNEKSAITEMARKNGGKILYATTSIEQQIEKILLRYFMGPFIKHDEKRVIFERDILQSSALTFHSKRELLAKIINANDLLHGQEKNKVQSYLKNIMGWRNAFAHGKIQYDNMAGCFINYYSGSLKTLHLDDKYWDLVETSFKECSELLNDLLNEIEKKF